MLCAGVWIDVSFQVMMPICELKGGKEEGRLRRGVELVVWMRRIHSRQKTM
jgi:hypothetical protein